MATTMVAMKNPPPKVPPPRHLRSTDIRGIAQLATQATVNVALMAEGVHQSVWSTLGAPGGKKPGQTRGITGLVYQSVRGIAQLLGNGVDRLMLRLEPLLEIADSSPLESPQRAAVLAALNGVLGDRLVALGNPLATPMDFRFEGRPLLWSAMPDKRRVNGKVLLLIHGLCMNDLQWQTAPGLNHGRALQEAYGFTPVYLRYNTGLHTSENGKELAAQLEQLVAHWPVPVEEITIVAHSMGGLITRSALRWVQEAAAEPQPHWPALLKSIVFLGTPHHGAPLERAGNWVDVLLGSTPYSRPFAKLGQLRSAGITDLRYGHVLEADWLGHDRFRRKPDRRTPLPLPEDVACFTVAATLAAPRSLLAERLLGDGLVPLRSALGQHDTPEHTLAFPKTAQHIIYRMNHMELLHSPLVTPLLLKWIH